MVTMDLLRLFQGGITTTRSESDDDRELQDDADIRRTYRKCYLLMTVV